MYSYVGYDFFYRIHVQKIEEYFGKHKRQFFITENRAQLFKTNDVVS